MTLILTQSEVCRTLTMAACIDVMAEALAALARGDGVNPLRTATMVPGTSRLLGLMPGYLAPGELLGLKAVAVFGDNHGTRYDSHQGVVVLFEPRHGRPDAIVDASAITAIRTAAVSGVATRLLAPETADDLAVLGTGVQARSHLEAMALCRTLRRVRVYSRDPARRAAFVDAAQRDLGVAVEAVDSARAAVEGADLVCTTTSSPTPVLEGAWLAPGTHVNAVGSSVRSARELDGAAMARARLFVDRRESTVNESGDYLAALAEGAIGADHIVGEIGDILTGTLAGRRTPDETTLFKSLGLAVEDIAAARHAVEQARAQGIGTDVELGGLKHADD